MPIQTTCKSLLTSFLILFFMSTSFAQQSQKDAAALYGELLNLKETTSVLYIAAHPDDENTRLLTYMAKGRHYRTAYLSLTRGDGGQNLIGDEQGAHLGIIRSRELIAAREVDGTSQFFTRAVDFGYSKSAEEALTLWEHDSVLADVVWVIRNFRPDIIITRFPPDERAGHGHHTASAMLALEAYEAAADPTRFPEQLAYCSVWQPERVFWNASSWWDKSLPERVDNQSLFGVDVGGYDPLLGTSYGELAAKARSKHRSQGFGVSPYRGEQMEFLQLLAGTLDEGSTDPLFTKNKWVSWKNGSAIYNDIENLLKQYDFHNPSKSVADLLTIYQDISSSATIPDVLLKKKSCAELLAATLGLWAEPVVQELLSENSVQVVHEVLSQTTYPVKLISIGLAESASNKPPYPLLQLPEKNVVEQSILHIKLNNNIFLRDTIDYSVVEYANATSYWLQQPFDATYRVSDRALIGRPDVNELPSIAYTFEIDGMPIVLWREMVRKEIDPARGELYEQPRALPFADLSIPEEVCFFRPGIPSKVQVIVNVSRAMNGYLKLDLPDGWNASPENQHILLDDAGSTTCVFEVTAPIGSESGIISPVFESNGKQYNQQKTIIAYEHIPKQVLMESAVRKALVLDMVIPQKRIAYIEGAGDLVDESLEAAGLSITRLTPVEISSTNFNDFDVVITGVRAYNISDELIAGNAALMTFVEAGGTLIIQYNTLNSFTSGKNPDTGSMGPFPFSLGRSRTTDETAKPQFLLPTHWLFTTPNKISEADFQDWVQERGLYYVANADKHYEFPLGFADPDEEMLNGSMITTTYGDGVFIYTGISFFRQLPAAVPGAYRIFFNMIAGGK